MEREVIVSEVHHVLAAGTATDTHMRHSVAVTQYDERAYSAVKPANGGFNLRPAWIMTWRSSLSSGPPSRLINTCASAVKLCSSPSSDRVSDAASAPPSQKHSLASTTECSAVASGSNRRHPREYCDSVPRATRELASRRAYIAHLLSPPPVAARVPESNQTQFRDEFPATTAAKPPAAIVWDKNRFCAARKSTRRN